MKVTTVQKVQVKSICNRHFLQHLHLMDWVRVVSACWRNSMSWTALSGRSFGRQGNDVELCCRCDQKLQDLIAVPLAPVRVHSSMKMNAAHVTEHYRHQQTFSMKIEKLLHFLWAVKILKSQTTGIYPCREHFWGRMRAIFRSKPFWSNFPMSFSRDWNQLLLCLQRADVFFF